MNANLIAKTVKDRRKILNIDQKTAAELSAVSVHTYSNIESATGNPSINILCKILDALGMEIRIEIKRRGDNQ